MDKSINECCVHDGTIHCNGNDHYCAHCGVWLEPCEENGTWPSEEENDEN